MTISKDRVKPSPLPDSWKLAEIFTTGIVLGSYLAMMTVIFFWAAYKTNFFPVSNLHVDYLQLHVIRDQAVPLNYRSLELNTCFCDISAYIWGFEPSRERRRGLQETSLCSIPASKHHQSGSHIRDAIPELVFCRTPWSLTRHRFCHCSAGEFNF